MKKKAKGKWVPTGITEFHPSGGWRKEVQNTVTKRRRMVVDMQMNLRMARLGL